MAIDHLVVLAAGRGNRMDPLTRTRPKVLLPVAGRPLMEHVLRAAASAGFRRASLVVHHEAQQVRDYFANADLGLQVDYVDQEGAGGTGHAVAALAGIDHDFVLVSGDSTLDAADLQRLRSARGIAVGGRRVENATPFGLLDVRDGKVHGITEKPRSGSGLVNAGAYRATPDLVARCQALTPSPRGELELTDAISALADDDEPARFVEVPSWREAGRPWDLLELQAHLLQGLAPYTADDASVESRVEMQGTVHIESGAQVRAGTYIEGPVWIGAGARVGPNAYLRPATSIGRHGHVGAGVEIKNSILGDHTHVPHLSYVGDSVLGAHCNLGAGTQVANLKHSDRTVRVHWQGKSWVDTGRRKFGVVLGDGVKTGVNSSLNPGTVLAPGVHIAAGEVVSGWRER